MSSHHPAHAKANPSDNGAQPGARLGRFLFPNKPRAPINPELLKHEQERAQARQDRAADKITAFSGSMLFVYIHIVWFGCWIGFGGREIPLDASTDLAHELRRAAGRPGGQGVGKATSTNNRKPRAVRSPETCR